MQPSNRSQGGAGSGGKGSLHGSKSLSEGRPLKMEVLDAPVREAGSIQDTDPSDQSFLDLDVSTNILTKVLEAIIEKARQPEDFATELAQLTQKSLMARDNASAVQVVKKQVYDVICFAMERKVTCRELCGKLLAYCINKNYLSMSVFVSSLGHFLISCEDIVIDVPKVYEYIPEFLGPAMLDSQINLTDVADALSLVAVSERTNNDVNRVIKEIGKYFVKIGKPEVLAEMWRREKLSWSKFVRGYKSEAEMTKDFLVPANLYYISNEEALKELQSPLQSEGQESLEKAIDKLLEGDFDEAAVKKWVSAHFETIDENFIMFLSMAIIRTTMDGPNKYNIGSENFEKKQNLLRSYLEDSPLEMHVAALHGIQHADNQLEHPKDLLKNVFNRLFEFDVISRDAFYAWRESPAYPEGKGVAEKLLAQFFTHISDMGSDEEDSPVD